MFFPKVFLKYAYLSSMDFGTRNGLVSDVQTIDSSDAGLFASHMLHRLRVEDILA